MSSIHIIHENNQWIEPLRAALSARDVAYDECFMDRGTINPFSVPPVGIFFNKMSASSYTRDHLHAPDYTLALLSHLEASGRRVINGSNALRLEISKIEQYTRLHHAGIQIPRTVAAFGVHSILDAAKSFEKSFVLKPNRGGKGIGVQLFRSQKMLSEYLANNQAIISCDDIFLVQDYIEAETPIITRLEFIGGKFVYAVAVDTSQGFELCPAEACRIDQPAVSGEVCAINADDGLFKIISDFTHPIVQKLEGFLHDQKIDVAGIEFIVDKSGQTFVYDMNMNTNYNPAAEKKASVSALNSLIDFLSGEVNSIGL
jgi:hypothetical protein